MQLRILSANLMLAESKRLLSDPAVRAAIESLGELCKVALNVLDSAHDRLATQGQRRGEVNRRLADLIQSAITNDGTHDDKARGLYFGLQAIIAASAMPELAQKCAELQEVLFPEGLSIVRRSYMYEVGALEAMQRRVTAEHIALMKSLTIGTERLYDWYTAWIAAGEALRRCVQEREHLTTMTARTGSGGTDVDGNVARQQWITAVHLLVSALDMADMDAMTRELILGPLEASIAAALRGEDAGSEDGQDGENSEPADPDDGTGTGDDDIAGIVDDGAFDDDLTGAAI